MMNLLFLLLQVPMATLKVCLKALLGAAALQLALGILLPKGFREELAVDVERWGRMHGYEGGTHLCDDQVSGAAKEASASNAGVDAGVDLFGLEDALGGLPVEAIALVVAAGAIVSCITGAAQFGPVLKVLWQCIFKGTSRPSPAEKHAPLAKADPVCTR